MNETFDYHRNESPTFESNLGKTFATPEIQTFENFWSCIEAIAVAKRFSAVYVNPKISYQNIFFTVRDCVADDSIYAPFRQLSNRILEPLKSDSANPGGNKSSEPSTVDGEKKFYFLRVFVLSYEPLTLEIHCVTQATCREDWDSFVCRVKRTPINSHQFLSYNGTEKPKNSDEVNHIIVIRGDKKPNKIRACSRGCTFSDMSHSNNITLETEYQGDPTLQTQVTQPSSN
uniref:Uncharacterized protein n=1 Tax=Panagrolaimus superbus TaxID=310955 RepID=A0A914Y0K0_9BILA